LSTGVIKAIEVAGITRIDDGELIDLICFRVGDTLDMDTLRKGIRRAMKKGIFHDIRVLSEPYNEGIKLRYVVQEIRIIKKISIKGIEHLRKGEIKKRLLFKKGEDFKEELLDKAKKELRTLYDRKGFPEADVEIDVIDTDKDSVINMEVNIREGDPLIIESIDAPAEARSVMKTSALAIFDRDVLDKDIEKIRGHYQKQKHFKSKVGPYRFVKGILIIPVDKGPRLKVDFINNSAISKKKLEEAVPFMEEEKVTNETIADAEDDIRNLYVEKGYYHASVTAAVEEKEEIHVSFDIHEGEKTILEEITFEGVSIPRNSLIKVMSLKESKPFNEHILPDDRDMLKKFYNERGYLEMDVLDVKKNFGNDGTTVSLHFIINEGPKIVIESIDIVGNEAIGSKNIMKIIQLPEKAPLNLVNIGDARYRILSFYKRRGFVNATVNVKSNIKEDKAYIVFRITENNQYIIGKIILKGNRKTKANIVRRELTFEEGETYNYDEILNTKQRLYNLGIFRGVSIKTIETGSKVDGRPVNDVLISIKESNAGAVELRFGYGEYEKFRGVLDVSYRNLGGYDREIGFRTEQSSVAERYIFHFREPWLFNQPDLPLKVILSKEESEAVNSDTREVLYRIDKVGIRSAVKKSLSEELEWVLAYEYSLTETSDVEEGVILSKEDTGTLGVSSVSPSLYYDTRDNPFNPTSGSFSSLVVKLAARVLFSEVGFIKTNFKTSRFFQLHKGIVLALSAGGGVAFSVEDTKELPLVERYFLGGSTTVRGYEQDMLGPKGQDDLPTGGNMFALINSELRFSIGKGFGLVTFIDGGNVWQTSDDINGKLRYTAGGGLRYKTPVGPVRVDYGHKISRKEDESAGEVHFSFGHAF
jgi:outer membrane protein insertion porin family